MCERCAERPRTAPAAVDVEERVCEAREMPREARSSTRLAAIAALALAITSAAAGARAQERTTLIRVLESAHDFRARVRAALALGSTHDEEALAPLSAALGGDDNAAVRAACASAL